MWNPFRRKAKPVPAPLLPAGTPVVVRATGVATTLRSKRVPSVEDVMSAAVLAANAEGINTSDPRIAERMAQARADLKQARASADATGQPVTLTIGARAFMVERG